MTTAVTVEAKQEFIRWLLRHFTFKRRESKWILNYLLSHEALMQNIHFTDEAHYCPRAIVMSVRDTEHIPFRFYKGVTTTADAESAFMDLRLNKYEKMYIQINYTGKIICLQYAAVQEENPHIPAHFKKNSEAKELAEEFLNHMSKDFHKLALLAQIDEALDTGNKELFMELTGKLQ